MRKTTKLFSYRRRSTKLEELERRVLSLELKLRIVLVLLLQLIGLFYAGVGEVTLGTALLKNPGGLSS